MSTSALHVDVSRCLAQPLRALLCPSCLRLASWQAQCLCTCPVTSPWDPAAARSPSVVLPCPSLPCAAWCPSGLWSWESPRAQDTVLHMWTLLGIAVSEEETQMSANELTHPARQVLMYEYQAGAECCVVFVLDCSEVWFLLSMWKYIF